MKTSRLNPIRSLQRGEISAIETYQQALELFDGPHFPELKAIHEEHCEAANTLRQHVRDEGEQPVKGSGIWGAYAKAVEGTATYLGQVPALKALKEGEEKGIKDYEDALAEQDLPAEMREVIERTLLPQTHNHVTSLDRIISAME